MKILHTSDWHIGRSLYGRKRYDEFSAFLDWLAEFIQTESIDVLLIAGDVFDLSTPSNRAQGTIGTYSTFKLDREKLGDIHLQISYRLRILII